MSISSLILGRPLASSENEETKIGIVAAIPAMGLDGLTSSAYGPEAALTVLLPLGAMGLNYIGPITIAILLLLAILYFSYRQTIAAYPVNGGSYTVAKENLGVWAGLLAAAALMIDYVLNVAVGISAGVAALVSAAPVLHSYTLPLCLGVLTIITLLNLRGTGEAGLAFALPTYAFIASIGCVLAIGIVRAVSSGGSPSPIVSPPELPQAAAPVGIWIVLRSFSSGCTAMTGVEAVSNGVSAFRQPTVKNAQLTLTVIVCVLAMLLGGIAYLARAYGVGAMPQDVPGYQSVLSQLTQAAVGRGVPYYFTMASVLSTLCLSANTSFVDFPRLSRMIAQDDFLPRGFAVVGRRLVYSVGIVFLSGTSALLLIMFGGITDRLIPLFAVGAFSAFTLSQSGMVVHWRREIARRRTPSERRARSHAIARMCVNGLGAIATGAALVIILAAKFAEGAWITVLAVPVLLTMFKLVKRHYVRVHEEVRAYAPLNLNNNRPPIVLVPTRGWDRLTWKALRFSTWLSTDVIGLHISNLSGEEADEEAERVKRQWAENVEAPAKRHGIPIPRLRVTQSPYRNFLAPIVREIEKLKVEYPDRLIGVVIPEVVETNWWQWLLHRRKPRRLRESLIQRGDHRIVVIDVPWYIDE